MRRREADLQDVVLGLVREYLQNSVEDGLKASTKELARRLRRQGNQLGLVTRGDHLDRPAYLVDYCWTRDEGSGGRDLDSRHRGLVLAVEIEWHGSAREAWKDFVKLADVRADGRLFITSLTAAGWNAMRTKRGLRRELVQFWQRHPLVQSSDWVVVGLMRKGTSATDEPELHLLTGRDCRRLEP